MNRWPGEELRKISETDDLHISPFREDGETYGTPTWIWSVVVDDALYVRPYSGQKSGWYQAAMRQKAGRITAAGIRKEVSFEAVQGPINDRIEQPVSEPDDRRTGPRGDREGHPARSKSMNGGTEQCLM